MGTPAEIIDLLNSEINAGLADVTIRAWLDDLGIIVLADYTSSSAKVVPTSGGQLRS